MLINILLSVVMGIFVLEDVVKQVSPTLAIGCVWHNPATTQRDDVTISIVGTVAVMVGQVLVFAMATWYLHSKDRRWLSIARAVGLIILLAIAIGAAARVIMVSQAFGSPSVPLTGTGERDWSFGQLLPLLLLLLPLLSAVEILRGKISNKRQSPMHANIHQAK